MIQTEKKGLLRQSSSKTVNLQRLSKVGEKKLAKKPEKADKRGRKQTRTQGKETRREGNPFTVFNPDPSDASSWPFCAFYAAEMSRRNEVHIQPETGAGAPVITVPNWETKERTTLFGPQLLGSPMSTEHRSRTSHFRWRSVVVTRKKQQDRFSSELQVTSTQETDVQLNS